MSPRRKRALHEQGSAAAAELRDFVPDAGGFARPVFSTDGRPQPCCWRSQIAAARRCDVFRRRSRRCAIRHHAHGFATPYPGAPKLNGSFSWPAGLTSSCECLGRSGADVRPTTLEEITELVRRVDRPRAQAIFVSCTDLRAFELVDVLEGELGKPVLTSNQVTLWAILQVLRRGSPLPGHGKLFA
jgi:arylmalonate decarboxylase